MQQKTTKHYYEAKLNWTGNSGMGTENYSVYERSFTISIENKPEIYGSSDPAFRGDVTKYNPEELLLASLSSCHMLWYLHFCSVEGVVVLKYNDYATATMEVLENESGKFLEAKVHPKVIVKDNSMVEKAMLLHAKAHEYCFIANSVNFPVKYEASCQTE